MNIALAMTYHDPQGRLYHQIECALPTLTNIFYGIAVRASHAAQKEPLALLDAAGALIRHESRDEYSGPKLGIARREAVELSLEFDAPFILYCDGDRAFHWAENYPDELAHVVSKIPEHDFTVFGRTKRAYLSHPKSMRDTEAIVNHIYHSVTGQAWDMMVGARGISRHCAEIILKECSDEHASVDVSWPLNLRSRGDFSIHYIPTEGLEFETHNRYHPEITDAGGLDHWISALDADIDQWLHRVGYVQRYLEIIQTYAPGNDSK